VTFEPGTNEEIGEDGHIWWTWKGMRCCKLCGIVKRPAWREGKNKPCKGLVRVTLRTEDA